MNRNILLALVGGAAAGLLAGYLMWGNSSEAAPVAAAPVTAAPVMPAPSLAGAFPGGAALPNPEVQARVARAEAAVMANPKEHGAWVDLGNAYFDSNQYQKSVDAYAKALAMQPNDPNVLTDQGVMYRDLKQIDKALANFQKANKIDPNHMQSLLNIGVVYATDMQKPAEAAKAWNKVIATAPNSQYAAQARQMLSALKP